MGSELGEATSLSGSSAINHICTISMGKGGLYLSIAQVASGQGFEGTLSISAVFFNEPRR